LRGHGIAIQHFILRDQAARAFGEEHLVAEFDRRLHLAALDKVRVGIKDLIELLSSWNLLAAKHTVARLINHSNSKIAKVLDLLAKLRDSQIGDDVFAARFSGRRSAVRALSMTSSAMPMSSRYVAVCCSWRCLDVIR
jgi:hypothetical protein